MSPSGVTTTLGADDFKAAVARVAAKVNNTMAV